MTKKNADETFKSVKVRVFFFSNSKCLSAPKTFSGECVHNPVRREQSRGRDWRARRKRQRMNNYKRGREREKGREKTSPAPAVQKESVGFKPACPFISYFKKSLKKWAGDPVRPSQVGI